MSLVSYRMLQKGKITPIYPCENARGQMLSGILGSAPCFISGQIIEMAIENPHHKGQKRNLLLDSCLQEITD